VSVIEFPSNPERARQGFAHHPRVYAGEANAGIVLILPVVRVDRDDGTPAPHRKPRKRNGE
jgi:hypothetical protein